MAANPKYPRLKESIVSLETCVAALASGMLSRRAALQNEIAVGLVVFAAEGGTHIDAKNVLNEIYSIAGYQCIGYKGIDYKNVNKRINVTAALFDVMGKKQVAAILDAGTEQKAFKALFDALEPYQFYSLDDVLEYCGKPNNKTARQRANEAKASKDADSKNKSPGGPFNRRASDIKGAIRIDTKAIHLSIPPTAKPAELLEVAAKLIELANRTKKPEKRLELLRA